MRREWIRIGKWAQLRLSLNAMLSDRDYMREEDQGTRLSWTVMLLIALVVVFAADAIAKAYLGLSLQQHGALSSSVWQSGWVWQLVTFQFLHGGFPICSSTGWVFGCSDAPSRRRLAADEC